MDKTHFTGNDIKQLAAKGITMAQAMAQLHLLQQGAPHRPLARPCTVDDGIKSLTEKEINACVARYDSEAHKRQITKFVPASGAATRMFMDLIQLEQTDAFVETDWLVAKAERGDKPSQTMLTVMQNLPHFAFYEALTALSSHEKIPLTRLEKRGHYLRVLRYLLHPVGLNYARMPKGLILFHRSPRGPRTAFEEHLVEAAQYAKGKKGICRLHFTVSDEHLPRFEALLNHVRHRHESDLEVKLNVHFSTQKSSTDTLATTPEGAPFRNADDSLLFRPGGHGALMDNLNRLNGDILFIKNIDNVVPDHLKPTTTRYKKVLGGLLMAIQAETFLWIRRLTVTHPTPSLVDEAYEFGTRHLNLTPPAGHKSAPTASRLTWILEHLNRPIRVCGVVKNSGEPGGGPFWVEEKNGGLSLQIVESVAVSPKPSQQCILNAATHFNPVDIVCGTLDVNGAPFDLSKFINPEAVFISQKSKAGQHLNALELPGLWNGAMAYWNTLFVEVPPETFNPVKTITDLIKASHLAPTPAPQPESGGPP